MRALRNRKKKRADIAGDFGGRMACGSITAKPLRTPFSPTNMFLPVHFNILVRSNSVGMNWSIHSRLSRIAPEKLRSGTGDIRRCSMENKIQLEAQPTNVRPEGTCSREVFVQLVSVWMR